MISLWAKDGRLLRSRRINGKLVIDDIGEALYTAYCKASDAPKIDDADASADFPGWWKLTFADYESRKAALETHGDILYEADVSPVRRFLSDNACIIEAPRRAYLDIETDSRVPPREQAEFAEGRILSWALVDEEGLERVEILTSDSDEAEANLVSALWKLMAEYDQVAAWGGDTFDFPVIDIRSRKLARRRSELFRSFWDHNRRIHFVDHLACFKRHHMAPESGDDKTSLKLNDVCQSLLGKGKHDFDARKTWEAWAAGGDERLRMGLYNLQDTVLLRELETATGYLGLQQTLAEVTWTFANSHGLKPMPQVDGYMLRQAHLLGTHLPSKKQPTGEEAQYEGAFVMKPVSLGLHRTVHVCDFKSLYPTVIRSLNIGAETKDLLGCVAFGTGVSFGTEIESMLAGAVRMLMEQRDYWKKKAKADPNDKYAERMNKAFKIACNAVYGVMGCTWSRFYDVQIAESITLGAKALILATIEACKDRGWGCIYGDTDSIFVTGCSVEEFKEFTVWCNKNLYPKMLADIGANLAFNCIELDYEKCFDRLVFPLSKKANTPASKRYFGSYIHYAFKPKDKHEIRGLEYMRGDGIRFARHMQKDAIYKILAGESGEQLEEWVQALRHRVMTEKLPVEDIMQQKGLGMELAQYKSSPAHVRLAREQVELGEDIGIGSRIAYVISNGKVSPNEIIAASDYTGEFDRYHCWNLQTYPCLLRVLAGAFPDRNWARWITRRPKPALAGQLSLI